MSLPSLSNAFLSNTDEVYAMTSSREILCWGGDGDDCTNGETPQYFEDRRGCINELAPVNISGFFPASV